MGEASLVLTARHRGHSTIETTKVIHVIWLPNSLPMCRHQNHKSLIALIILLPAGRREIQALCRDHTCKYCKENMALNAVIKLQDANTKLEENSRTLKKGETVTFALQDYQNKKKMKYQVTLPSFYTHPNGYHMALRVYANGNGRGEGTHVSVYVLILEGKFDKGLKWPFVGEVTVTLLNQLEDKNHYTGTIALEDARVGWTWGFQKYIPHSALAHDAGKNTQYLKDDTLYFRMSVKVADYKPWLECSTF